MTSPWAQIPENENTWGDGLDHIQHQYKYLGKLDLWGDVEANDYLNDLINMWHEYPALNIYGLMQSSQMFRGIHHHVVGTVEDLIRAKEDEYDIISGFSKTLNTAAEEKEECLLSAAKTNNSLIATEQQYESITSPTDADHAAYVWRLYAILMKHGSSILDEKDYGGLIHSTMLSMIASKATTIADKLTQTSDVDATIQNETAPPPQDFIEQGYTEFHEFLTERTNWIKDQYKTIGEHAPFLGRLSREATHIFTHSVMNMNAANMFLCHLKERLEETKKEGLWPSLYEKAANAIAQSADETGSPLPEFTKHHGIGQFVEEILSDNAHASMDPREAVVIMNILSSMHERFPSPRFKAFLPS